MSFYDFAKVVSHSLFRLVYRVRYEGLENEPEAPYVIIANHSSYVDPVLVGGMLKNRICFIAKASLQRHKILSLLFKYIGVITVERDGKDISAIRQMLKVLQDGKCLGLFPQGTRIPYKTPTPDMAMPGFAVVASLSKATVFPASIVTSKLKPKAFRRTTIIYHKPIPYEEYMNINENPSKREITDYCFSAVCAPFDKKS